MSEIKTATGAAAGIRRPTSNWDSLATGSAVRQEMHLPVATCDACHMLLICNCDENLHMPPTRGFQSFGVLIMKLNVPLKANTLPRSPFAIPPRTTNVSTGTLGLEQQMPRAKQLTMKLKMPPTTTTTI